MNDSSHTYTGGTNWTEARHYFTVLLKHLPAGERPALWGYFFKAFLRRFLNLPVGKERIFHFECCAVYADAEGLAAPAMMFLADMLANQPYSDLPLDTLTGEEYLLDAGANAGFFTILACLTHPRLKAYCIEPHPDTYKLLERNLSLNGLSDRVICLNEALSDQDGILSMRCRPHSSMLIAQDETSGTEQPLPISARRLDSLVHDLGGVFTVIKMDVEGHEQSVLEGAQEVLKQVRSLAIETHSSTLADACTGLLEKAGFTCRLDNKILLASRQAPM
jgi:FkbM family methyltransferase